MTKKEAVLKYFSAMDIDMLELVLDDDKTYQGATKEIFLQKLDQVFNLFKKENDTQLAVHRGSCHSEFCIKNGTGYSFVGNHTNNYISFVFEENAADFTDIHFCTEFELDDKAVDTNWFFSLEISTDETADFIPDIDFLLLVQKAKTACEELLTQKQVYLNLEDCEYWQNKYHALNEEIAMEYNVLDYNSFTEFDDLYGIVNGIVSNASFAKDIESIKNEYYTFNPIDEPFLLDWLVRYEQRYNEFDLQDYNYLDTIFYNNGEAYLKTDNHPAIYFTASPFENLSWFKKTYVTHYMRMLEKYNTLDIEERNRGRDPFSEYYINPDSLKYHLDMTYKYGIQLKLKFEN